MCRICDEGGSGEGKFWYLDPRNHARRLYKLRKPGVKPAETSSDETGDPLFVLQKAIDAKCEGDMATYEKYRSRMNDIYLKAGGTCQVITLDEAKQITNIASPLAKLACTCRKHTRGIEEKPDNFTCLGLGSGMFKWERWPERYRGGVVFMSPEETREWLDYWDDRGMMHCVMNYGGQIGGICNCDYPDCIAIRQRLDYDLDNVLMKGHYVAKVDYDLCIGCGTCAQRCQFGAIKMEVTVDKANIDHFRCFGCALCYTECPEQAVTMIDKQELPALMEVW
jgi:Pyruvate/2-oxoacid:ferredoxin oxidoreductase delta subunit